MADGKAALSGKGVAAGVGGAVLRGVRAVARTARGQMVRTVGGPARARVIALFGAVLALSGADAATIGAVAPQLEHGLHTGNTGIGLLSSAALLTGAVFVLPVGLLVDRFKRIPMLSVSIVLWSLASLLGAFSHSYGHLLLTRLALGAVTATAGPAIASLTGDYFPASERGRVYGASGAGKSTILRVIGRQPAVGVHVRLAGADAASIDPAALAKHVTLVAQDAHVFDGTLRDNLRLGAPDAAERELWDALAAAALDDPVAAFPAGLDTPVGPGGAALSGGQRRRLSVAQGLLRHPDILLLDEPTEGLDTATAARVLAGVRAFDPTAALVIALHDRQAPALPWRPTAQLELRRHAFEDRS